MIFKKVQIILFSLLIGTTLFADHVIRILVATDIKEVQFIDHFSLLVDNKLIRQIQDEKLPIQKNQDKVRILNLNASSIYFKNENNAHFKIGHYQYRGDLELTIHNNILMAVNYLNIEDYIKGVLPNEISPKWPIEVLKAQAVAARTFAYYYKKKNKDLKYDLTDSTFAQVYKGKINENENFNSAIKTTQGEVLVYDNKLIQAFFHSVCGGHTESAESVWGKHLPYLRGVPCNYCRGARHYKWEAKFTEDEIIRKLKKKGYKIDSIRSISPAKRSRSGRWVKVKVQGKKKKVVLSGNLFRILLGIRKLRSTKFTVHRGRKTFLFRGKGWGHGVGFCQWGAKKMAEKGYKYYQILRYYYRKAKLKRLNKNKIEIEDKETKSRRRKKGRGFFRN